MQNHFAVNFKVKHPRTQSSFTDNAADSDMHGYY